MLTKKEFCTHILQKAQQRYGKKMGELDVFYAPEVGIALEYFGLLEDPMSKETIEMNPPYVFVTHDNKSLTYKELLTLLPDDTPIKNLAKKETIAISEDDLKLKVGERKFFKIMDILETFNKIDLEYLIGHLTFLKKELDAPAVISSKEGIL